VFRVLMPPSPSCSLPSPFGTVKVLSPVGPNKTMLLSSSLAHRSEACRRYRASVPSRKPMGIPAAPDLPLPELPAPALVPRGVEAGMSSELSEAYDR